MARMSIQLYTLREECEKDFEGVFKFCHEQGFEGVEFAGFYGHTKEEVKEWLTKYNLIPTSAHVPFKLIQEDINEVMEFHKYIGNKTIIIPNTQSKDEASAKENIEKMKSYAKTFVENGFDFGYHNHSHELFMYDGKTILEHITEEIPEISLELDTFWVYAAGINPRNFMLKNKDRLAKVIHIKDGVSLIDDNAEQLSVLSQEVMERVLKNDKERGNVTIYVPCAVGKGTSPVEETMATVKELGIEWIVLENDMPFPDAFADVSISAKKLLELLKA